MSAANVTPEKCWRCGGTGRYAWGAIVNGKPTHEGDCYRCVGGGQYPTSRAAVAWRTRVQTKGA